MAYAGSLKVLRSSETTGREKDLLEEGTLVLLTGWDAGNVIEEHKLGSDLMDGS